jgi:hypothetical protein
MKNLMKYLFTGPVVLLSASLLGNPTEAVAQSHGRSGGGAVRSTPPRSAPRPAVTRPAPTSRPAPPRSAPRPAVTRPAPTNRPASSTRPVVTPAPKPVLSSITAKDLRPQFPNLPPSLNPKTPRPADPKPGPISQVAEERLDGSHVTGLRVSRPDGSHAQAGLHHDPEGTDNLGVAAGVGLKNGTQIQSSLRPTAAGQKVETSVILKNGVEIHAGHEQAGDDHKVEAKVVVPLP